MSAANEWNARAIQLSNAEVYRDGLNAAGTFLNRISSNADIETGAGFGAGAVFNLASRDPVTDEASFDQTTFWLVAGDIAVSVGGAQAMNWGVGSLIARTLGFDAAPSAVAQFVSGIQTDFNESRRFLSELFYPAGTGQNQGLGIVGGAAASLVYSQIVAGLSDKVDSSGEVFGWHALQLRTKFNDLSFGPFGDYTGKAGGRIQINISTTKPFN